MESSVFNDFVTRIKPFQALWNSIRVASFALGAPYERKSIVTRIVLRPEQLTEHGPSLVRLWLDQIPDLLVAVVDFPREVGAQILKNVFDNHEINLEHRSTVDRVLLRWRLPDEQAVRWSGFSWSPPFRCEGPWARNVSGESRTCLAVTGTGDYIRDVMSDDFRRRVDSKLPLCTPHFDGIHDLFASGSLELSRPPP